jgi:pilus assembly protein CpaC
MISRRQHEPRSAFRLIGVLQLIWVALLIVPPAWAQQPVGSPSRYVVVPVGEGQLFQLDQDAKNVLVADSGIADVHAVSPRMIYVYGKRIGETTLHATGSGGVEASLVIRVQQSAAAAQAALPPPTTQQPAQ